jgi:WXXGXW repeat (2 copies)
MRHSIRTVLLAAILWAIPAASFAQISVGIAVRIAPPELPVYEQPICPGEGYIWTPGYWAYGDDDYYWVPGTWVLAPRVGVLWTPGYWGWGDGGYFWHVGYWGPHVGYYGGVNYGFGYVGVGYLGGRWERGHFAYNRSVNNVNVTIIHNTYNTRISNNYRSSTRVSYNGGNGGIRARESAQEQRAAREQHIQATGVQSQHEHAARSDRSQFASVNHGRPNVAATPKPGAFNDRGVVHANAAAASNSRGNARASNSVNSNDARPNGARNDRPSAATQPNTSRGANTNRTNTAQTNNASRNAPNNRQADARAVSPRNTSSDRPNNSRPNTADRTVTQHQSAPRSAPPARQEHSAPQQQRSAPQQQRSAPQQQHSAPQQQHSAPQQQHSAPQQGRERDPHAKP